MEFFLVKKLLSLGFQQSLIDECVFHRDEVIFIVYVDDGVFLGPDDRKLTNVINEIKKTGLDIEVQGHPANSIGVTITKHSNGYLEFTQWALIDSIINDVNIGDAYTKPVPANYQCNYMHTRTHPNSVTVTSTSINYLGQTT